jgi:hypothetical protein
VNMNTGLKSFLPNFNGLLTSIDDRTLEQQFHFINWRVISQAVSS